MKYLLSLGVIASMLMAACSTVEAPTTETEDLSDDVAVEMEIGDIEAQAGFYEDAINHVSFNYPAHWVIRENANGASFAVNFDYLDGLADTSETQELEGTLVYRVVENPEEKTLSQYYLAEFDDCMAKPVPEGFEFGNICWEPKFDLRFEQNVDGNYGYLLDWEGVPESGAMQKSLFLDVNSKGVFVVLSAIKTGVTDEEKVNSAFDMAFDSLVIE